MVIEARLPKLAPMDPVVFVTSALFKTVNELEKVALVIHSHCQEMEMVGHAAVGVKREKTLRGSTDKLGQRPAAVRNVRKSVTTVGAANRYERESPAEVVTGRQPWIFVVARHEGKLALVTR